MVAVTKLCSQEEPTNTTARSHRALQVVNNLERIACARVPLAQQMTSALRRAVSQALAGEVHVRINALAGTSSSTHRQTYVMALPAPQMTTAGVMATALELW